MEMTEFVVEVEREVLALLHECLECSLVQDAAPFQVLCTSNFAPWHQKHDDYLEKNHSKAHSTFNDDYYYCYLS